MKAQRINNNGWSPCTHYSIQSGPNCTWALCGAQWHRLMHPHCSQTNYYWGIYNLMCSTAHSKWYPLQQGIYAFIGSCNTTRDLSHQLLLNSSLTISLWELFAESDGRPDTPCDLIIPGELYCHKILSSLLSDSRTLQPSKANQKDIQTLLDLANRQTIREDCRNIRDKARLNAVSTPHSGSWLRALPSPNLSLAMNSK